MASVSILSIVSIAAMLTIISGWAGRAGWSLLTIAASGSRLRVDNAIAAGGLGIVRILSLLASVAILLVEDGHLCPHIARAGLAELGLGDQVALEAGHIAVQHGQSDYAGDHRRRGHHNGEEGHSAQLAMLLRLIPLVVQNYRLFLLIHLPHVDGLS